MALAQVRPSPLTSSGLSIKFSSFLVRLEVRLPRTWLSLVEEIAWNYDEETVDSVMGKTIQAATQAALDSAQVVANQGNDEYFRIDENIFKSLDAPDLSIGLDLLSPVPSRDPSPRRLRPKSKSPARWKILRSISDAIQNVMNSRSPGVYGTLLYNFFFSTRKGLNPFSIFQFRRLRTPVPADLSVTSTSIISEPSACVAQLKRASIVVSSLETESKPSLKFVLAAFFLNTYLHTR